MIHWTIDTVSQNGSFLLNVPGMPDGIVDSKEMAVLGGVTGWMRSFNAVPRWLYPGKEI